ncbi:hypothetical protein TNCV_130891 [Trichonephila clavipes]|nr:hypothetical protein TNCV_130891 [Trichonephila clavipes]
MERSHAPLFKPKFPKPRKSESQIEDRRMLAHPRFLFSKSSVKSSVVELYYGEDKKIRVVKIKTQYSTCKRAISKICVLPMEDP